MVAENDFWFTEVIHIAKYSKCGSQHKYIISEIIKIKNKPKIVKD